MQYESARCHIDMKRKHFVLGFSILLGLVGATLLVAFGVLYAEPYQNTKDLVEAECELIDKEELMDSLVTCQCAQGGSQCLSQYPCIRLWVNFTSKLHHVFNASLYDSFETYTLQRNKRQCSFHYCSSDWRRNALAVKAAHDEYGEIGGRLQCYYHPQDLTYAIIEVVTKNMVIHAMFWPSLAVLVGFSLMMCVVFKVGPYLKLERKPWKHHDFGYQQTSMDDPLKDGRR